MDPVSIIVLALASGAAAGLQPTVERAITDAYDGIKGLIQSRYGRVNLDLLETAPASKARQAVVKEELEQTDVGQDEAVLRQAQVLLGAIKQHAPDSPAAIGVNLKDIEGATLEIEDIIATGMGVNVESARLRGDIKIKQVRAGTQGRDPNP